MGIIFRLTTRTFVFFYFWFYFCKPSPMADGVRVCAAKSSTQMCINFNDPRHQGAPFLMAYERRWWSTEISEMNMFLGCIVRKTEGLRSRWVLLSLWSIQLEAGTYVYGWRCCTVFKIAFTRYALVVCCSKWWFGETLGRKQTTFWWCVSVKGIN